MAKKKEIRFNRAALINVAMVEDQNGVAISLQEHQLRKEDKLKVIAELLEAARRLALRFDIDYKLEINGKDAHDIKVFQMELAISQSIHERESLERLAKK